MSASASTRRALPRLGILVSVMLLAACEAPLPGDAARRPAESAQTGISPARDTAADAMPPIMAREVSVEGYMLPGQPLGEVWKGLSYGDVTGEQLLVLRREATASDTDDGYLEHVRLSISQYAAGETGNRDAYLARWQTTETVECEGLDFEVGFLPDALRIEDLDGDGQAEIIVGYSAFCGGGIEPHDINLILRAGGRDYRLQGESLIQPPGGAPAFGGTYATTPAEADIPQPLRTALLEAWERVKRQPGL